MLKNLITWVEGVASAFSNFDNCHIRALLYVGGRDWRVLDSIVVKWAVSRNSASDESPNEGPIFQSDHTRNM